MDNEGLHKNKLRMAKIIAISALAHLAILLVAPYLMPDVATDREQMLAPWLKPKTSPKEKDRNFQVVELVFKPTDAPKEARFRAEFDQKTDVEQKASPKPTNGQNDPPPAQKPRLKNLGFRKKSASDPLGIRPVFAQNSHHEQLPDVKDGDETKLNAWQWKHAPFFNRIKEKIASIWSPQNQINRYDPNGSLIGTSGRITLLSITIDQKGFIKELFVKESSEVAYLDEEALRTFREAAPFSYPPDELFDHDGKFSFTFAFRVEINRGFSLNFDWGK